MRIDGPVSAWTFSAHGTYQWLLHTPPYYDLDGTGTYSRSGATLTVSGIVANTLFSNTAGAAGQIALSGGGSRFNFRDEGGDRWRYEKVQ